MARSAIRAAGAVVTSTSGSSSSSAQGVKNTAKGRLRSARQRANKKKTEKKKNDTKEQSPAKRKKGDIIGKSRFVLPLSGQSQTEATVVSETELDTKKENIFVP